MTGINPMPHKINVAQIRASLKKKGYQLSFAMEMSNTGNKTTIGRATSI